jgi:processing peptidase subunit beta
MVISAAGAIDHTQLCDLSVQYFGSLPMKSISGGEISMEKAVYTGSDIRMRFDSDDIAHISLAYEGASWTSKYAFPIMLLQTMLGSYDRSAATGKFVSSKLCQTVAEHELAHSITTFNTCYKDTGLFGVFAVAPSNKLDDLFWYIMGNLVRMVHNPTREELDRAKNQLKTCMLMNLDGYSNIAEDIGRQILTYGRRMTPAEVFCRIDAITLEDIKETARNIIHDQDHVLAAVGGIHELPDYQWFRRHSYYLRY